MAFNKTYWAELKSRVQVLEDRPEIVNEKLHVVLFINVTSEAHL